MMLLPIHFGIDVFRIGAQFNLFTSKCLAFIHLGHQPTITYELNNASYDYILLSSSHYLIKYRVVIMA